jgi:hypothetical protein
VSDYRALIEQRRTEVVLSLSDEYLAVRTCIIRVWVQFTVECEHTQPWRMHWPASRGDDELSWSASCWSCLCATPRGCV